MIPDQQLVPTIDGRTLKIRPCMKGEGVQLGIIGKRGGLVEATSIALTDVPGLILGVDMVSEAAWAEFQRQVGAPEPSFDPPEAVMTCL
jgi:hypothetical protein